MATYTLTLPDVFPNGTVVGAYVPPTIPGAAFGSAVNEQTVASDTLTFSGLEDGTRYVARGDNGRQVSFTTSPPVAGGGGAAELLYSQCKTAASPVFVDDTGDSGLWLAKISVVQLGTDWTNADGALHVPAGAYSATVKVVYSSYPGTPPPLDCYAYNGYGQANGSKIVGTNADAGSGHFVCPADDRILIGFDSDPSAKNISAVFVTIVRLGDIPA